MLPARRTNEEQRAFHDQIARGKAVAVAREAGLEMLDAERLENLLTDLSNEGHISILVAETGEEAQAGDNVLPYIARRGIEILRG